MPSPADAAVLAHPLLESTALPVPPVVVASVAGLVVAAATRLPARARGAVAHDAVRDGLQGWRPGWWVTRPAVVAVLAAATVAGRTGADRPAENLAAVLVVGLGWPLLVAACLALGGLWAWVDPWDTLARPLAPGQHGHAPAAGPAVSVTPAAAVALGWVWFLGAYPSTFSPRAVGAALLLYTVATLAGCLAAGRAAWLRRWEPFGLLATWWGLLPRRRLTGWRPPPGASALLGVLAGGLLFGALRLSGVWFHLTHLAVATLALAAASLAGAALLGVAERLAARRGAPGAVPAAAVPAVASVVLAVALTNDRLWLAVQLLPAVLDDPLGRGWDLLGGIQPVVRASPLGAGGRVLLQVLLLTAGHAAGAVVACRRAGRVAAGPAVGALVILLLTGVLAVSAV